MSGLLDDVEFIVVCAFIVMICVPLLAGIGFSVLLGLTGLSYLISVFGVALLFWLVFGLIWWC